MDVRFINPFLVSTVNALKTMAGLEVSRGVPFVKGSFHAQADMSGIIGLAGQAQGAVVLSFPFGLAKLIFEKMIGGTTEDGDPGIADAVGELANVAVGGAKAGLTELGLDFQISVPTVVCGRGHSIANRSDTPCLIIPFQIGSETFWLQVAVKMRSDKSV